METKTIPIRYLQHLVPVEALKIETHFKIFQGRIEKDFEPRYIGDLHRIVVVRLHFGPGDDELWLFTQVRKRYSFLLWDWYGKWEWGTEWYKLTEEEREKMESLFAD